MRRAIFLSTADKIVKMDMELREKMNAAHGESEELYKLYKQRLDNYTVAEKIPVDPITKVLFSSILLPMVTRQEFR